MTGGKEKFLCLQPFRLLNDCEGSSCTAFPFTAHKMKSVEWLHMNFWTFENKQKKGWKRRNQTEEHEFDELCQANGL